MLTVYGGLLVVVGALALLGLSGPPPPDTTALRWHVMVWDPWFPPRGLLLGTAGRAACTGSEDWMRGIRLVPGFIRESYHINDRGHLEIARLVADILQLTCRPAPRPRWKWPRK